MYAMEQRQWRKKVQKYQNQVKTLEAVVEGLREAQGKEELEALRAENAELKAKVDELSRQIKGKNMLIGRLQKKAEEN